MKYAMCPKCGCRLCKGENGTKVEMECPKCGEFASVIIEYYSTMVRKVFTVIKEKADTLKLLIDAGFRAEYLDIVNETVLRNPDIPVSKKHQRLIWTGAWKTRSYIG